MMYESETEAAPLRNSGGLQDEKMYAAVKAPIRCHPIFKQAL
jgi:hypothetical protein